MRLWKHMYVNVIWWAHKYMYIGRCLGLIERRASERWDRQEATQPSGLAVNAFLVLWTASIVRQPFYTVENREKKKREKKTGKHFALAKMNEWIGRPKKKNLPSTQVLWYSWSHGSTRKTSPFSKSQRQIQQEAGTSATCSSTRTGSRSISAVEARFFSRSKPSSSRTNCS